MLPDDDGAQTLAAAVKHADPGLADVQADAAGRWMRAGTLLSRMEIHWRAVLPIAVKAGIDPVYFGLMFVLNGAIGLITPPVGTVLNVVAGVGRLSLHQVIKGVNPFLLTYTVILFLFVLFPQIVTAPVAWMR